MPWKVTNGHWQRLCVVCAVFGQPCTVCVQDYWQQSSVLSTNLGYLRQNVMITQRTLGISGIFTVLFHQSPVFSSSYIRSPCSVTGLVAESMNPSNANGLASKFAAWAKISLWRTWCQESLGFLKNLYISSTSIVFWATFRLLGMLYCSTRCQCALGASVSRLTLCRSHCVVHGAFRFKFSLWNLKNQCKIFRKIEVLPSIMYNQPFNCTHLLMASASRLLKCRSVTSRKNRVSDSLKSGIFPSSGR